VTQFCSKFKNNFSLGREQQNLKFSN